jgi:hypothetical protein
MFENRNKSCDILGSLEELGSSIEKTANSRSKMDVVKGLFGITKSLTKTTLTVAGCAIKNTPKAIKAVKDTKDAIVSEIDELYQEEKKRKAEEEFNTKFLKITDKYKK